jgi:hypothetical protein
VSLWLHHWLHGGGSVVSGDVKILGSDGLAIEVRVEGLIGSTSDNNVAELSRVIDQGEQELPSDN